MTEATGTLEAAVARIAVLERHRRLQWVSLVLCLITVGGLLGAQAISTQHVLEIQNLILRDAAGKERGRIAVQGREAFLALSDENQMVRSKLTVTKDGPALVLYGSDGRVRANLVAYAKPVLTLNDAAEKIRLQIEVEDTGPFLTLYDGNEKTRALVGVGEHGPLIKLYMVDGNVKFSAP